MRVDLPSALSLQDPTQVKRSGVEQQGGEHRDVEKVASDFAGLLVQQMVREMFESVKEGEGPFGSGPGADIQRGIAESAISQSLTQSGFASLREAIERAVRVHDNATTVLPTGEEETAP